MNGLSTFLPGPLFVEDSVEESEVGNVVMRTCRFSAVLLLILFM